MNWDTQEVTSKVLELSSPNPEVEAIINLLEDGVSDLKLIGQKVRLDPILSARLLQLANSSFYGFSREVTDVEMACVILGANTIRNLVYTLVVLARFNDPKQDSRLDYGRIWHHNLMTASFSQVLSKRLKLDFQAGFTAGLFYNLGIVLMDYFYPDQFERCMEIAKRESRNLLEVELSTLGKHQQTLTGVVLDLWSFPKVIVDSITGTSVEPPALMALVVALSNVLATGIVGSVIPEIRLFNIDHFKAEPAGIDLTEFPELILEANQLYQELAGEFFPARTGEH